MHSLLVHKTLASVPHLCTDDVLHTLTGAMSLLRRCRVNAALTIQLFSQLFHFINMWLFNRLVTDPESGLCSHYWGAIIRQQLGHVEAWAEKQGLELAADCHLSRIVQVGCPILTGPQVVHFPVSASRSVRAQNGVQPNQQPRLGGFMCIAKETVVCWFAWVSETDFHKLQASMTDIVSPSRRPEVQGQDVSRVFSALVFTGVLPVGMCVSTRPLFICT